jgi:lipopolysaccharide heptosyltransferase I
VPPPHRILVVRPSSLGDVVRTVPALASLRRAYPDAVIDWLVNTAFADAVRHHPALSGVVTIDRGALRRAPVSTLRDLRGRLRERAYGWAIDLQGLFRSGVYARLSGAPRITGFADARELGWLLYRERVAVTPGLHHVDRYLHLLRGVGVEPVADMRLYPGEAARAAVAADAALAGRYAVVAPTTRGPGRAWPMERFAAVARHLAANARRLRLDSVVAVGLASEREACGPLTSLSAGQPRIVDRVGRTDLCGLMALVERAGLVVCNDSAAMHVAAAFRRPLVALLGPTRAQTSGPYPLTGAPFTVLTRLEPGEAVRHRDVAAATEVMRRITVEEVIAACEAALLAGE